MRVAGLIGFLGLVLMAGCGGGSRGPSSSGPMPPGATFTGVWFSPQYGEMQMRQSGSAVIGEYSKDERSGKLQGNVNGNVLHFTWSEIRELVHGRPTTAKGRGFFKYVVGQDGRDNILGEWGIDDDETGGGPWNGYRLRKRTPHLSSDPNAEPSEDQGADWGDSGGSNGGGDTGGDDLGGDPNGI